MQSVDCNDDSPSKKLSYLLLPHCEMHKVVNVSKKHKVHNYMYIYPRIAGITAGHISRHR